MESKRRRSVVPTIGQERYEFLDVLRGAALAGIVLANMIFRGVGLGLGGTMGPTLYLPLGAAIYVVQLLASRGWLERFQYGPLEWLWRMLTYGAAVPLTKRLHGSA